MNIYAINPTMNLYKGTVSANITVNSVTEYVEEEEKYIKDKIDNNAMMFSMIEKSTGRFIGNTEFFNFNYKEAEWGIVITASMQDKGYGKEALLRMIEYGFNEAGLDRIYLEVFRDNARACHVYEACGFKEYDRNEKDIFMEIQKDG